MEDRSTLAAVGDIFLGRRVEETIRRRGPGHIFGLVAPFLLGNDVVFGNLESPISNVSVGQGTTGLIARPAALDELKAAGFNAVSIANNHIMDFGPGGLQDTITELEKRGIGYAGAGLNPLDAQRPLRQVGGAHVTLLSYYGMGGGASGESGGPNGGDTSKVLRDIRDARDRADIVLISMHWGRGTSLPMRHQVEFAHQMVDQGAHVILGSGPHFVQPVERYKGGVIAYSLGNFVFDSNANAKKRSMILHVSFSNGNVENVSATPIYISAEYRPEPLDPGTDAATYQAIQALLVQRLDSLESDAGLVPDLWRKGLTPMAVLKKIMLPGQRAYPLSYYLGGLGDLIREKWFARREPRSDD